MRPAPLLALILSLALAAPAKAQDVAFSGPLVQGGLVEGRAQPGSKVALDGRPLRVSPEGVFLLGFGRDAAKATLEITPPGGAARLHALTVKKRKFDIQRIDGLPEAFVTPPPEMEARIREEGERVDRARKLDDARTDFLEGFIWPVTGRVSGVYGSQRILNGKPRAPHWGVDIAAPVDTPILAPAPGVVTLAADLYFTGWTLILDHGHGLSSVFMHMTRVTAREGQRVRRGEEIGRLGSTGRATGPHLHWGMNLFAVRLDPQLLAPPMPQ
jgi:murein DD-endopeptidase MepM/ murein hydrolase activator NlpD